jgi:hypothetical protein
MGWACGTYGEGNTCIQFDIQRTVHRDIFLQQNQLDALITQIYFWNRTLHVSDSFSVHQQESSKTHTEMGICHTGYADCLLCVQC